MKSSELPGFKVDVVLKHDDMLPFVRQYLRKRNPVTLFYWLFNLLLFVAVGFSLFVPEGCMDRLPLFFLGFAFFFLLIPVHELIHGLGYKIAGARDVSFGVVWRKLVFYAAADLFFTPKRAFVGLALAPFILLNMMLALVVIICPGSSYAWVSSGALIMHTAGCAGDFALVSYFCENWAANPAVCDDLENGQTYFYLQE